MDKLSTTKYIARTVVGVSTSFTVKTLINQNSIVSKPHHKAMLWIGSTMIGLVVSAKTEELATKTIDEIVSVFKSNQQPVVTVIQ